MAKLVDALDLESSTYPWCVGSSPSIRTILIYFDDYKSLMQKILIIGTRSQAEQLPAAFSIIKDILDSSAVEFDKILVNDVLDLATATRIIIESSEYDGVLAVIEYEAKTRAQDVIFKETIRVLNDISIYFSSLLSIIIIEDQQVDTDRIKKSVEGCLELIKIKNIYTNFSDEQVKRYKN